MKTALCMIVLGIAMLGQMASAQTAAKSSQHRPASGRQEQSNAAYMISGYYPTPFAATMHYIDIFSVWKCDALDHCFLDFDAPDKHWHLGPYIDKGGAVSDAVERLTQPPLPPMKPQRK